MAWTAVGSDTAERLRSRVDDALSTVLDPCSASAGVPANLAEMGLVREVTITPDEHGASVEVLLAVTHPSCFMAPIFLKQVEEQVEVLEGVRAVEVRLDTNFDWMPEDMAPAYRERLAEHRERSLAAHDGGPAVGAR